MVTFGVEFSNLIEHAFSLVLPLHLSPYHPCSNFRNFFIHTFLFIPCRYRTCCCFHQYCCWKFCWLEVFSNIWYNSEVIYCWILCICSVQLGFGVFFSIYCHSICTSSCWIWYSWNQGLLKRWDKLSWGFKIWVGCWSCKILLYTYSANSHYCSGVDTHGILLFRTLVGKVWWITSSCFFFFGGVEGVLKECLSV